MPEPPDSPKQATICRGSQMERIMIQSWKILELRCLSGHEHKYDDVRCAQFGLWQGARREHIPQWICNRRATQPQAKFGATLRAAVLFRPDFVARSLQIHCGICSSLTPRLAEKSLAANAIVFMFMTT